MLSDRLQDIIPNACLFKGLSNSAEHEDPSEIANETDTVNSLPRSILEIAANGSNYYYTEQFLQKQKCFQLLFKKFRVCCECDVNRQFVPCLRSSNRKRSF